MILLSTHYFINKTLYYSPEPTSMCLKIAKHKASLVRFDVVCGIASREAGHVRYQTPRHGSHSLIAVIIARGYGYLAEMAQRCRSRHR